MKYFLILKNPQPDDDHGGDCDDSGDYDCGDALSSFRYLSLRHFINKLFYGFQFAAQYIVLLQSGICQ